MPARDRIRLGEQLRRVVLRAGEPPGSDAELLRCFLERREEEAFAALLRRHGPMVLGVCRRVLGNAHDADDAFQATFLVLVRKAASIRPREALAGWLHGVAHRTALEARRRIARRQARERSVAEVPQCEAASPELSRELQMLVDRELSRLADKYRLPVVLCELQGRSRKEVARQLGIPEGTLSSRLATARKRLALRLARYGLTISAAAVAEVLAANAAACMPASLAAVTLRAALLAGARQAAAAGAVSATVVTLTEGVLKTMLITKLKTAAVVLVGVAALGMGTGGLVYQSRVGAAGPQQATTKVETVEQKTGSRDRELERLRRIAEAAELREKKLQNELAQARKKLALLQNELNARHQEAEAQRGEAEQLAQRQMAETKSRLEVERQLQEKQALEKELRDRLDALKEKAKTQPLGEREAQQAEELAVAQKQLAALKEELAAQHRQAQIGQAATPIDNNIATLQALREREREQTERVHKLTTTKMQVTARLEEETASLENIRGRIRKVEAFLKIYPPAGAPAQASPGGDKLARILEQLERLDRRLSRLEERVK